MKVILYGIFLLLYSVYVFVIPKFVDVNIIYSIIGVLAAISALSEFFSKGGKK